MNKIQLEMTLSMLEEDRKSLKKERDTYRDLCAELLEAINKKSIAENLNQHVEAMVELEWVIAKAKSILGESQ